MLPRKTLLLVPALAIAACATYPSGVEERFGASVKSATVLQTARPAATRPAGPPLALDGEAAKFAMDGYYRSFERPPVPTNVLNIGVGTSSTGSGSASR